ncbi:MAG: ATP-binding protein, partial [Cyanobacteriota bacterium]
FKERVSFKIESDLETQLTAELRNLSRDENTETTISRWRGYLLGLGAGSSPERVSARIWRELTHDKSLETFFATLGRLESRSDYRLCAVRHTLGSGLSLPRTDTLLQLKASVLAKRITLLIGSSGSGKSALCKLGMQTSFQEHTCLFLHASDVVSFTEIPDSTSTRDTRRLDELLAAQVIEKPIIIIDDLSDVDDQSFDSVLNLLQNALASETSTDVRFVLVAHLDAERRIRDKITARLGVELSIEEEDVIKLPQLPDGLQSSNALPGEVASLVQRAAEFGPALNLKLLDWLVSSVQRNGIDVSVSAFRNDLDLLAWFWHYHVGNGREVSEEGRVLIGTALSLAEKFTPDLSLYDSPVDTKTLYTLVRQDCLRVAEGRVGVTHRFVGDCARFRYLLGNRRNLEVSELATKLRNPLWSHPMRWFALYLAMESEETETWQELLQESSESNYLQLIDLLLD